MVSNPSQLDALSCTSPCVDARSLFAELTYSSYYDENGRSGSAGMFLKLDRSVTMAIDCASPSNTTDKCTAAIANAADNRRDESTACKRNADVKRRELRGRDQDTRDRTQPPLQGSCFPVDRTRTHCTTAACLRKQRPQCDQQYRGKRDDIS
jgi:hypothetical protein